MGQLFNRISRVVRAQLNSDKGDCKKNYLNEGTVLAAGGAVAGASIGKVGILAGGTGYSVGVVPLAAAGALTGAALYEVLRLLLAGDASSMDAAVLGGVAGAATSAAIGGVGVAVGGSGIGVGMASMAAGGAVVGLGVAGLNRLFRQGIDPEQLLDSSIDQMEMDLQNAHRAVINVISSRKRLQQQYEQAEAEVSKWARRAQLALEKGDEYLVQEALKRKEWHSRILIDLQAQRGQEPTLIKNAKQNLKLLEAKILEAKMMRTSLKAQITAARASGQLDSTMSSLGASRAMTALERMEEKMLQIEACSQTVEEVPATDEEDQFDTLQLGVSSNLDKELAEMKMQLWGTSQQSQSQFSGSKPSNTLHSHATVDMELEDLQRILDQL